MGETLKGKLLYAQQAARLIKKLTGLNVFENTRKREYIEIRSLLVYILKDIEKMTLFSIRDFFKSNGKNYDHSTVLHAYNNYSMYSRYNKKLNEYFDLIVKASNTEEAKKQIAKQIIDGSDPAMAEIFIYMVNKNVKINA
jgi:hypothetical protein